MKTKLGGILAVCFVLMVGCSAINQNLIDFSDQGVANVEAYKKVAKNINKTWPFYSGLVRSALGSRIDQLPSQAITAMDQLDALATVKKLDSDQAGEVIGYKIRMLGAVVIRALQEYAPDVLLTLVSVSRGGI